VRELLRGVLLAVAADAPPSVGVAEAAAGVGVLRARQGHGAAGLVEDLLALRPAVEQVAGDEPRRLTTCLDTALRAGVGALTTELAHLARTDGATRDKLTGVLARHVFEEALDHEVLSASRHGAPSLVVVDLDGLTRFMEVQGHLAGDLHLVRMTEILAAASRRSDVVGRLGVDQLALVLPRTDQSRALVVARRVLARSLADARAGERAEPGSTRHAPRLSVAVAWLPAPTSAGDLLGAAEQALDRARRSGGGVVETNRPPVDAPREPARAS
jgi:diguanylate cyclase (GGDEF)-like protein